jgi:predicted GNAT family acetyltransferase
MIDNSKNYVLLIGEEPISYVRLVTDETMVSLFSDVYTVPDHRRKGHAFNLLVKIMSSKPTINTHMLIRPTSAAARDLYKKCGFMFSDEIDFKNHGVMEFI